MANLQWNGISDNVDTGAVVEAKLNTSFGAAELALTALESTMSDVTTRLAESFDVELNSSSFSTQEPTLVDTVMQITFGSAIVNTNVAIDSNGLITFLTAGKYFVSFDAMYGRTGASGVSTMHYRALINGVQVGATLTGKLDDANTLVPFSGIYFAEVNVNDTLKFEFYRDSAGVNSGGLFTTVTGLAGWADSPSASVVIRKA